MTFSQGTGRPARGTAHAAVAPSSTPTVWAWLGAVVDAGRMACREPRVGIHDPRVCAGSRSRGWVWWPVAKGLSVSGRVRSPPWHLHHQRQWACVACPVTGTSTEFGDQRGASVEGRNRTGGRRKALVLGIVLRRIVAKGAFYDVECAIAADGSSPAALFLDRLKEGLWDGDANDTDRPSDEQLYDYAKFIALIGHVAREGEPPHARAVNYLRSGVWEFKHSNKRISFYDTPGDGTWTEKGRVETREDGHDSEYWWFPDFDMIIRLGHCFAKQSQVARQEDVDRAVAVREEDIRYDQDSQA